MKICILDGYSLNPGDLDWSPVERLGDVTLFDRTPADKIVERAADADIVLTNKVPFSADTLRQLPRLRFICVLATGYNIIATEAAARQGVVVANIPSYSTMSVAQMAFAHILNITNHVASYAREVADGKWTNCPDFCFWDSALTELAGKTMGIVGLGNTGMATARIAVAMGMKVVALTSKSADTLPEGITPAPLDDVLASADVVSLHCPLTPSTRHLINAASIAKMKPSAILINTGRGPLVNEQDLADALNNGTIFAAGLDVLSQEPPRADNPLLTARNCYITPHIAWATTEARERLMNMAISNLQAYIAGTPENVVNK